MVDYGKSLAHSDTMNTWHKLNKHDKEIPLHTAEVNTFYPTNNTQAVHGNSLISLHLPSGAFEHVNSTEIGSWGGGGGRPNFHRSV